jgi:hypothetical protein
MDPMPYCNPIFLSLPFVGSNCLLFIPRIIPDFRNVCLILLTLLLSLPLHYHFRDSKGGATHGPHAVLQPHSPFFTLSGSSTKGEEKGVEALRPQKCRRGSGIVKAGDVKSRCNNYVFRMKENNRPFWGDSELFWLLSCKSPMKPCLPGANRC